MTDLNETARQRLTKAVVSLLTTQRLSGEVLLEMPRTRSQDLDAPIGLAWQHNQLVLEYNDRQLNELTADQLDVRLQHEVLHAIWQHPLRYASSTHPRRVALATDIAVNQYLKTPPQGTMTLADLEKLLQRPLAAHRDSRYYLRILTHLTPAEQGRIEKVWGKLDDNDQSDPQRSEKKAGKAQKAAASHQGWQTDQSVDNPDLQKARLKALLSKAWKSLSQKNRGLLPGEIQEELERLSSPEPLNWRQLLIRLLGRIPSGKQDTRARFNRRQPLRMELPGQIDRLNADIYAFVDNSGSMSDQEIAGVLTELQYLTVQLNLQVEIIPFDARVHSEQATRLLPGKNVSYRRTGGGGTCFQAIFDWLQKQHVSRQQATVVVLTDGWGESELAVHGYRNVLWLLSTESELSVKSPAMRSVKIGGI
ncbi:VWA-like domain-containing protein [Limosilactobacillus sp. WILCCON 0053]|uniref:VWA-like domain-containing protein n=1 Tax=Limosilactobacillus allomucosae TaxID=3142938 RepID=A0ABV0I765_9LACO